MTHRRALAVLGASGLILPMPVMVQEEGAGCST